MQKESQLQSACVRWFRYQYPQNLIFAVPNGGSRNLLEARNLKTQGVLAGVSDLIVIAPQKVIFIEMKIDKGRQNENQKTFQQKVEKLGFEYVVCRSIEEFMNICKKEIR